MAMKKLIILLMLGLLVSCGPSKEEMVRDTQEFISQHDVSKLTPTELDNYVQFHYYGICNFTAEQKDAIAAKIRPLNDTTAVIEDVPKPITQSSINKFLSIETGLPTGVVVHKDYEGDPDGDTMLRINNHVSIKGNDGYIRIAKDVDVDLFNTIKEGDIIE